MAEYIEREAFIDHIRKEAKGLKTEMPMDLVIEGVANEAKKFPSADVEPVRHGRWIEDSDGLTICSECEEAALQRVFIKLPEKIVDLQMRKSHYCPNCGCHMDLEGANER